MKNNNQDFLEQLTKVFPETKIIYPFLEDILIKCNCQKIVFADFKIPALGMALHDGIYLNNTLKSSDYSRFIFVLLHELAHQYQYKKYGVSKMYKIYTKDMSPEESANFLMYCENIADEFATRKMRELIKKYGNEINIYMSSKGYSNIHKSYFVNQINKMVKIIEDNNCKELTDISNVYYNMAIV